MFGSNWERWRLGALRLSTSSTLLVFVVIPAAVIALVAALVLSGSDRTRRSSRRYRPGRPYDFQPIWFLASPEQVSTAAAGAHAARPAIAGPVLEDSSGARVLPGPTGGASDSW
ncbi:aa3-type cytochrome oxidase subunit CtaJ [Paractinoplanes rishiriensis]|uniref:aa3-type cytochrome oxidase subunit CtaJ n=1 Tax=Paractinoplanes rishiriensis TaxID=1050105 RepID=UPI001EF2AD55|nr:hypothetical protein [Actinoplanes rishiriensis]